MKDATTQIRSEKAWKEKALAYAKRKGWSLTYLFISSVDKEMERNP